MGILFQQFNRQMGQETNDPEGFNHALKDLKLEEENKRIEQLEKANGIGQKGEKRIANRIDELEQRVAELEGI